MNILLTGATGFLGKNITANLHKHLDNYILYAFGSKDYDLRHRDDCVKMVKNSQPDVVIHAAGTVGGILANRHNPGLFMYENLIMGTHLIDVVSKTSPHTKFIMIGTVCAYPKYTTVPFQEKDLWNGYPEETNAPYGIAKKTLMKLLETYHEQYGMNATNLVPVNMYGPYDHFNDTTSHVIPALILKFNSAVQKKAKKITIWGTGLASREFLFAPDFVEAIALAVQKDTGPSPINIGTGQETKINKLVFKIAEQMCFDGEIEWDTSMPDGQPKRNLDTQNAEKILSFKAKTNLDSGLRETINWFKRNKE